MEAKIFEPAALVTKKYVDDSLVTAKEYTDDKPRTRVAVLTAAGAVPATTDGAEQEQVEGSNFDYYVCMFDKDTDQHIFFAFVVPPDYQAGNILVNLFWFAGTAITGDVVWNIQTLGRASGETFDAALGSVQAKTQTTAGTAGQVNKCAFDAFNPGWVAGDVVIVKISRDADNVADDMDDDAIFLLAEIQYTGR